MQVLVLGGGVIGVTTAWWLARAGAQVTVIEREPATALATSFANAGQLSYGYSTPWAAPGIPLKALRWLLQREAPLRIRPDGSWHQLAWLARMLRECTPARYERNKARMLRLADYSRTCLRSLREETGIAYEGRQRGTLQLLRTRAQFEAARRDIAVLEAAGIEWRLLQAEALGTVEPALGGRAAAFAGGLHLPGDETGDCHRFTQALAARAAALGVRFEHGAQVEGLVVEPARGARRLRGVRVDGVVREAEATVVALGVWSRELVRDAGLALPLYPMKGYSLTLPLADAQRAPVSTVLDETWKVAVTRFDARIRVGGMAEVAGHDLRLEPARRATLERVLGELFPGAAAREGGTFWSGLRPKTPDSTPIVGATPVEGLWLNTGHGTLGWTLACGSAALLADLVLQRHPAISPDGLDIARYAGGSSRRPRLAPSAAPGTAASVTRHAAS